VLEIDLWLVWVAMIFLAYYRYFRYNGYIKILEASMDTIRITATEFQNAVGLFSDRALREPVTITKQGRDNLVLLSAEEFMRMKRRDRKVGLTGEISEEMFAAVFAAEAPDAATAFDHEVK
jgi:prevent-host-death family protein